MRARAQPMVELHCAVDRLLRERGIPVAEGRVRALEVTPLAAIDGHPARTAYRLVRSTRGPFRSIDLYALPAGRAERLYHADCRDDDWAERGDAAALASLYDLIGRD